MPMPPDQAAQALLMQRRGRDGGRSSASGSFSATPGSGFGGGSGQFPGSGYAGDSSQFPGTGRAACSDQFSAPGPAVIPR